MFHGKILELTRKRIKPGNILCHQIPKNTYIRLLIQHRGQMIPWKIKRCGTEHLLKMAVMVGTEMSQ